MGTPAKPLTPEKTKMCFPKKEVWRHVSAPGKKSGWKEVHIKTGKTNNTESAKENHSVKKLNPNILETPLQKEKVNSIESIQEEQTNERTS
jgi:hypothetical protein